MSGDNIPSQENREGTVNSQDGGDQERIDTKSEGTAQPKAKSLKPLNSLALGASVALLVGIGIWFYVTRSFAADYVPLLLIFASAIAAIAGKSWDDQQKGFSRITLKGRVLAALAVLGFIGGIRSTQISHEKLKEVGKIQTIAYHQLMEGVSMILFPITSSWRNPPKNDVDILVSAQDAQTVDLLRKTRIVPFADQTQDVMMMTADPRMFSVTANGVRIASSCGYPHRGFRALYELFDFCIDGGEVKIKESEQIFISNLDPETIRLVHDVLEDEFYISHYKNLSQHDDLFYQGLYEEAGTKNEAMTADRTWRAMLEVQRTLLPENNSSKKDQRKEKTSPWLYLGTYYFSGDSNYAGYQDFLAKIGRLVKHIDMVTKSNNMIDTF
ncbi:MAG TPA: hypothetical protein VMT53_00510 [Terriglobales bacterium]|nr:hypothetical protein [Terriglobales bacterium]